MELMVRDIALLKKTISVMIGVLCVLLSLSSVALVAQVQYEPELVIISPHTKDFLDAEKLAFEKYVSSALGAKVTVLFDMQGSPQAYGKIVEWAGKPNADIFWGGEINLYTALVEKGLLEAHTSPATQAIPTDLQKIPLKDTAGYWVASGYVGHAIVYNLDALKRLNAKTPEKWDDIFQPQLKGQIVMCPPSRSSSAHINVEVKLVSKGVEQGWAFWRKTAAYIGGFVTRSGDVHDLVSKGEYAVGFGYDYRTVIDKLKGFRVDFTYSDETFFNPEGIALLKGAKNPKIAKAFIDFLLSKEGQSVAVGLGRLPVLPEIKLTGAPDTPAGMLNGFLKADSVYTSKVKNVYDVALAMKRFEEVNKIFDETITNKHAALKDAWNAIEAAQKAITEATTKMTSMEKETYDTSKVKAELNKAKDLVTASQKSFDTGDYTAAKTSADKASDTAKASIGLAEKLPPYDLYAGIVVALVIVVAVALWYVKKKGKKQT